MQIVLSGSAAMVGGWPGYLISGPSSLSYRFYNNEMLSGYLSYVLSGSAHYNIQGVSGTITGVGSLPLTLLPGEISLGMSSDTDYIVGNLSLEGFNTSPLPDFTKSTLVIFDEHLYSPHPLLRISCNGRVAVYLNGRCISRFEGTKMVGDGPGHYRVVAERTGDVTVTEGFKEIL